MGKITELQEVIDNSNNIVFFGGAGVSTASGIPDFRSADGIYNMENKYKYPPEYMLSYTFYQKHKEEFFSYYKNNMVVLNAQPNAAHLKLAQLEKAGKLKAVITQNIDGLHQKAGSENVLELHGSILRNYCEACGVFYDVRHMIEAEGIPKCTMCGGDVKPDVVLYEESLDSQTIQKSTDAISNADVLIIGGTSLAVYPAAGFVDLFSGSKLVIINKTPTPQDGKADLVLGGNIAEIFDEIVIN